MVSGTLEGLLVCAALHISFSWKTQGRDEPLRTLMSLMCQPGFPGRETEQWPSEGPGFEHPSLSGADEPRCPDGNVDWMTQPAQFLFVSGWSCAPFNVCHQSNPSSFCCSYPLVQITPGTSQTGRDLFIWEEGGWERCFILIEHYSTSAKLHNPFSKFVFLTAVKNLKLYNKQNNL